MDPAWCLVANVKAEVFGDGSSAGTRHFTGGTRIWCDWGSWGDGLERIRGIGRHRGSRKLVALVLPTDRLVNWRVALEYSPAVISLLWRKDRTREQVEWMAEALSRRQPPDPDVRGASARVGAAMRALSADPWALDQLAPTAAELAVWTPRRWAREPDGPEALRVLRDWLLDRGVEIEPDRLAQLVIRRAKRAATRGPGRGAAHRDR